MSGPAGPSSFPGGRLDPGAQDALIQHLLAFRQWDYMLRTQPAMPSWFGP